MNAQTTKNIIELSDDLDKVIQRVERLEEIIKVIEERLLQLSSFEGLKPSLEVANQRRRNDKLPNP